MAAFQVVAVYPSGRRFPVRDAHDSFLRAEWHRERCAVTLDPGESWTYAVDVTYRGADGCAHTRLGVTRADMAPFVPVTDEGVATYRWDCAV